MTYLNYNIRITKNKKTLRVHSFDIKKVVNKIIIIKMVLFLCLMSDNLFYGIAFHWYFISTID